MTTLSWKRKLPSNIHGKTAILFQCDEDNDKVDEAASIKTKKKCIVGDSKESIRLMEEGITLAEQQKYKEAIGKFNNALLVKTDNEAKLHEMKAQALLELNELYEAIESSEKAIKLDPLWAEAYQTLGRTQINYGELDLAIRNFSVALHLKPDFKDIRLTDLPWALELKTKEKNMKDNIYCGQCNKKIDNKNEQTNKDVNKFAENITKCQ